MRLRTALLLILSLSLLSACDSTRSLVELRQATMPKDPYDAALAAGYRDFSAQKQAAYDWWDSKYFADKGLLAASGRTMLPEEPEQWDVADTALAEFTDARSQLMAKLEVGRAQSPEVTAAAVLAYDRWVTLADAGWNTAKIEEARDAFFAALGKLQQQPTEPTESKAEEPAAAATTESTTTEAAAPAAVPFGPPTPAPAPAAAPEKPAEAVETTSTVIYFPINSAALDAPAKKALAHLVDYIKSAGNVGVLIHGHADLTGSEDHNQELSQQRADNVAKALAAGGIPQQWIHTFAFGGSDPKVPTKEGTKERLNRRVEIFLE